MELIHAREAANIASATRAEIALMRASLAEHCVREEFMPCITEEAGCGRNVVAVEIALNSDAFKVRDLILSILKELGYNVKLGENNREFIIGW
jgi:hypothetical protein